VYMVDRVEDGPSEVPSLSTMTKGQPFKRGVVSIRHESPTQTVEMHELRAHLRASVAPADALSSTLTTCRGVHEYARNSTMSSAFRGADRRAFREATPYVQNGSRPPSWRGVADGPAILTITATYQDPRRLRGKNTHRLRNRRSLIPRTLRSQPLTAHAVPVLAGLRAAAQAT
jgi:hypothetical protein